MIANKLLSYRTYVVSKGAFTNYVDKLLAFFDHLPPYVDIFYLTNVDKKATFLDYLPILSCNRTLFVNGP